jgi:hypothetical protein
MKTLGRAEGDGSGPATPAGFVGDAGAAVGKGLGWAFGQAGSFLSGALSALPWWFWVLLVLAAVFAGLIGARVLGLV